MRKQSLELRVLQVLVSKRHRFMKGFLFLLSIAYRFAVVCYQLPYRFGWKREKHLGVPIVCVGNIVAGGTGKTPFVQRLAKDLPEHIRLAIVSTAYRAQGVSHKDVMSTKDRYGREIPASYCGDEPFLLQKHLPHAAIYLSKDRKKALQVARQQGAHIVILDDGFQQKAIFKDSNVLVVSAQDPLGLGHYLPRGFLRESPKSFARADCICVTGPCMSQEEFTQIKNMLRSYTKAPIMGAKMRPLRIQGFVEGDLTQLQGKKVGLFCGIGKPQNYRKTVEDLGVDIVEELPVADHATLSNKELLSFAKAVGRKGGELILCTEKDFVKMQLSYYNGLPICYVESELEVIYGKEHYEALRKRVAEMATQSR